MEVPPQHNWERGEGIAYFNEVVNLTKLVSKVYGDIVLHFLLKAFDGQYVSSQYYKAYLAWDPPSSNSLAGSHFLVAY